MEERPGKRVDGWSKKIYTKSKSTSKNEWVTKKPTALEGETRAPEMFSASRCRSHCYRPAGISGVIANVITSWLSPSYLAAPSYIHYVMSHGGLQHYVSPETNHASRIRRFGFTQLDELRQTFCHSFCKSADTMPYFFNLVCIVKCPELCLPHRTTTESKYNEKYNNGKYIIYTSRNCSACTRTELNAPLSTRNGRNAHSVRASSEHNTLVRIGYRWNASVRIRIEHSTPVRIRYRWNVSERSRSEHRTPVRTRYRWNVSVRSRFEHTTLVRTRNRCTISVRSRSEHRTPVWTRYRWIVSVRSRSEHRTPVWTRYRWIVSVRSRSEHRTPIWTRYRWNVSARSRFERSTPVRTRYRWIVSARSRFERSTPVRTRYR
ncbi:hypothetical protein ALC57_15339 [Trachymyrmex cornetzi]|uniref:Uncharacterized protein n=1 Tax=Trachymyrmex cornetzi TaxID=471704 RepID=A0A195DIE8_9HYME|nr:hypothetical protein ALC57_15339 [Trachymyrmex cornetzi]